MTAALAPAPIASSSPAAAPAKKSWTCWPRWCRKSSRSYRLAVCASVGLLTAEQAAKIKAAGIDRVNHNLNSSRRFYPTICTTHTYDERLATLETVRAAGLEICSGGIIGMGEDDADVVDLALAFGRLKVEATPINFLQPIHGTPLAGTWRLNPRDRLKREPLPPRESEVRAPHRRGPRDAPRPLAAAGPVPRQLDLRRRLPYYRRPTARRRFPHDSGDGVYGDEVAGRHGEVKSGRWTVDSGN